MLIEKPPGARMRAQFQRLENVHAVVASAAAVTLLVAGRPELARMEAPSQEQALEQQRRRDRLEQAADGLLAGLLRAADRSRSGACPGRLRTAVAPARSATRRRRRPAPAGQRSKPGRPLSLVYVPILPAATQFDDLPFQQAERLEFHDRDYAAGRSGSPQSDHQRQARCEQRSAPAAWPGSGQERAGCGSVEHVR